MEGTLFFATQNEIHLLLNILFYSGSVLCNDKTAIRMVKFEGHLMVFHVKAMWLLILL